MTKKDSYWDLIKISYISHNVNSLAPRKNYTIANVYDDKIWGKNWTPLRQDYKRAHDERAKIREEADAQWAARNAELKERKSARLASNKAGPFSWAQATIGGTNNRYHITPDGRALKCTAKEGNCPYGGGDNHFHYTDGGPPPNRMAQWIIERREGRNNVTAKLSLEGLEAEEPRALEEQIALNEQAKGEAASVIELRGEVMLDTIDMEPLIIERKIGNTYDNRLQDHAYWVLTGRKGTQPVVTDNISLGHLEDFVDQHLGFLLDEKTKEEAKAEIIARTQNIMLMVEGEASRTEATSAHYSTIPLDFDTFTNKNDMGFLKGSIDYGNSSFEPEHVSLYHQKKFGALSTRIPVFDAGFEVREKDAGEGTASWKVLRTDDGSWEVSIQGTRGELALFKAEDALDAERIVEQELNKRVKVQTEQRNLAHGVKEKTKSEFVKERKHFIRRLLTTSDHQDKLRGKAVEKEAEGTTDEGHKELFNTSAASSNTENTDKLFNLFG